MDENYLYVKIKKRKQLSKNKYGNIFLLYSLKENQKSLIQ